MLKDEIKDCQERVAYLLDQIKIRDEEILRIKETKATDSHH